MKPVNILIVMLLMLSSQNIAAQTEVDKYFTAERLSERVLILRHGVQYFDAVTAIMSEKGIIVIDAGQLQSLSGKYRQVIEKEFGRSDFIYVINTHSHLDHTGGNQVFKDAEIIAHNNCIDEMKKEWNNIDEYISILTKVVGRFKERIKNLDIQSDKARRYLSEIYRLEKTCEEVRGDRILTVPTLTFVDQLNIDLGDIKLNIVYFGRAHSASDILIHIPEEKLLFTGDLFSKDGAADLRVYEKKDVKRWKTVLKDLGGKKENINTIINGHGQKLTQNDLKKFRETVTGIWDKYQIENK